MIEIKNVTKYFGKNCAINNVSLFINRGDLLALLGPNGAGKSTLLSMLTGLINPSHGDILINGDNIKTNRKKILRSVGVVFENPTFYEHLTGRENLELVAKLKFSYDRKKIVQLLNMASLLNRANDPVKKYSLGMRQRLALACALVANPEILILDEPTNGLDPEGIQTILDLLDGFSKQERKTIVISSHQIYDVESICNRIAIINIGRILCEGKLDELLHGDTLSCFITTQDPESCRNFLSDKPWVQDLKFINQRKSLKEFYLETIKKIK